MPPNHFESEVESFLEGSHGDRTHIKRADHHTVTPLCGTLLGTRCAWPKGAWVRVRARVCATWALPAPLRPPTRRENQGPFGPKWRSGALSGVAVR